MNHAINMLTTKNNCDALLESAIAEKEELDYRRFGLLRKFQAANNTIREIDSALMTVEAELAAWASVKKTVYQGHFLNDMVKRIDRAKIKAESKRVQLTSRKAHFDAYALVQKENAIDLLDDQISKLETFIAVLSKKKEFLPAAKTKAGSKSV